MLTIYAQMEYSFSSVLLKLTLDGPFFELMGHMAVHLSIHCLPKLAFRSHYYIKGFTRIFLYVRTAIQLTLCILMEFLIQIKAIKMGLPII